MDFDLCIFVAAAKGVHICPARSIILFASDWAPLFIYIHICIFEYIFDQTAIAEPMCGLIIIFSSYQQNDGLKNKYDKLGLCVV